MARTKIEHLKKQTPEYDINFIVGIDDNPDGANNAMFYVRMESVKKTGKDKGKCDKAREIWLSNEEMKMLSVLLGFSSKYWDRNTLEKNTAETKQKIKRFKRIWKLRKKSLSLD